MVDPEIGWRLEFANFPGAYPHSHTKFVVIDGDELQAPDSITVTCTSQSTIPQEKGSTCSTWD